MKVIEIGICNYFGIVLQQRFIEFLLLSDSNKVFSSWEADLLKHTYTRTQKKQPSGTFYLKNSWLPHQLGDVPPHTKLTHALKTQCGTVSKGTDFPFTNREHPRLLSVLIETNGCVDTGEKLGRNRLQLLRTGELLQWYITAPQYIIVIVIYFPSLLLQLRHILFNNTANVRAKNNSAIVEYEWLKVAIHIKNNAMNWNIFLIMQQKSYSVSKVFQLFSAGDPHRVNPVSLSDWASLRQIADSIYFILIERHTGITVCESLVLLHLFFFFISKK